MKVLIFGALAAVIVMMTIAENNRLKGSPGSDVPKSQARLVPCGENQ